MINGYRFTDENGPQKFDSYDDAFVAAVKIKKKYKSQVKKQS